MANTRDFLAHAARMVRIDGRYVRENKQNDEKGTAETAFWNCEEGKEDSLPEEQDYEVADAALAYAQSIPADAKGFVKSVRTACSKSEIRLRDAFATGAILDLAIRATEDAEFQSAYAGSVTSDKPAGFVLALRGVKIVQKREITVRGFNRNIVKFATQDGDILTWWTSKMPALPVGTMLARFEGRIKREFDADGKALPCEYQGISETIVKNCVLVPKVA